MVRRYKVPPGPQKTAKARAEHARKTGLRWDHVIAALNHLGIRPGPNGKVPRGTKDKVQGELVKHKIKMSDQAIYKILQRITFDPDL
jgi:hypothetical protein